MKGKLEFTLPEEQEAFDQCFNSYKYVSALNEIHQYCRSALKHGHDLDTADAVFEQIFHLSIDPLDD